MFERTKKGLSSLLVMVVLLGAVFISTSSRAHANVAFAGGDGWVPIPESSAFGGTFDGNGHTILGLMIPAAA